MGTVSLQFIAEKTDSNWWLMRHEHSEVFHFEEINGEMIVLAKSGMDGGIFVGGKIMKTEGSSEYDIYSPYRDDRWRSSPSQKDIEDAFNDYTRSKKLLSVSLPI